MDAARGSNLAATAGRAVVPLLFFSYLLSFGDRFIFSIVMKPAKASLGFTDSELGLLAGAAFAVSYSIASPLGGYFVDRLNRKALLAGAIVFWSAATLLTGFVTSLIAFAVVRAAVGVGEAALNPLAFSLISDAVPAGRRARVFSLYLSAGALGSIAALFLGGGLVHLLAGSTEVDLPGFGPVASWRTVFMAASLPGFVLAACVLARLRLPSRAQPGSSRLAPGAVEDARSFLRTYWPLVLSMFVGLAFCQLGAFTLATWNIVLLQRVHGWELAQSAVVIGLTAGVSSLIGCLLCGRIIEAVRNRGTKDAPLRVAVAASLYFAVLASVGVLAPTPWTAVLALTAAFFASYMPSVCLYAAMADIIPAGMRGRYAGFNVFIVGIITNSIGPYAVGALNDHLFPSTTGIQFSLATTLLATAMIGAAVTLPGLRSYRRRLAERTIPRVETLSA